MDVLEKMTVYNKGAHLTNSACLNPYKGKTL